MSDAGNENERLSGKVGGNYGHGPTNTPGGNVDTGESPVPPYEGRSTGPDFSESTKAKTETVERQLDETKSEGDAEIGRVKAEGPSNPDPETGEDLGQPQASDVSHGGAPPDPHGVGTSTNRRGEDVKKQEGTEPGRTDLGTKGKSERPYGTTDVRDSTSIDVEGSQPIDDEMMNTGGSGTAAGL
ncbi:MAG: hypothetical protein QOJ69_1639 [Actinomycetota bacterium]|nr:hypothetical protein [Actinomycetota bacterium]